MPYRGVVWQGAFDFLVYLKIRPRFAAQEPTTLSTRGVLWLRTSRAFGIPTKIPHITGEQLNKWRPRIRPVWRETKDSYTGWTPKKSSVQIFSPLYILQSAVHGISESLGISIPCTYTKTLTCLNQRKAKSLRFSFNVSRTRTCGRSSLIRSSRFPERKSTTTIFPIHDSMCRSRGGG